MKRNPQTCPVCSGSELSTDVQIETVKVADGTSVPYETEFSRCLTCGEEFLTKAQLRQASRIAAGKKREHSGLLSPLEIAGIRSDLGLIQEKFERLLGVGKKSVVRWEAGTVCQSRAVDVLLREVAASPQFAQRLAAANGVELPSRSSSADEWRELLEGEVFTWAIHSPRAAELSRERAVPIERQHTGEYTVITANAQTFCTSPDALRIGFRPRTVPSRIGCAA